MEKCAVILKNARKLTDDRPLFRPLTYIPVGGGAGEMAMGGEKGGKLKAWVVTWVMGGAVNK